MILDRNSSDNQSFLFVPLDVTVASQPGKTRELRWPVATLNRRHSLGRKRNSFNPRQFREQNRLWRRVVGKTSRRRAIVAVIDRIDPTHRLFTGLFFDHVCTRPGERAIMKMPLNAAGFIPRSARIAPIAPSTLIGSALFASANAFSNARAPCMCQAVHSRVSFGSSRLNDSS